MLVLAMTSQYSLADEPAFTRENAHEYFDQREHLAVIVKIGGGFHAGRFTRLITTFDKETDIYSAQEKWQIFIQNYPNSSFLVLLNIKGELEQTILVQNDRFIQGMSLGEPYVAFLETPNEDGIYTINSFEYSSIAPEIEEMLVNKNVSEITTFFAQFGN